MERKRAFKEENRSKIQNTCIQSGIKNENKKVFIQTNDFKKEKSMPLDGIEPRHKIHHVWHSQCFNPLSYPELSHQKYKYRLLWENSVSEFFVFFFVFFAKFDPTTGMPLKWYFIPLNKPIKISKTIFRSSRISRPNDAEIYHLLWESYFSQLMNINNKIAKAIW